MPRVGKAQRSPRCFPVRSCLAAPQGTRCTTDGRPHSGLRGPGTHCAGIMAERRMSDGARAAHAGDVARANAAFELAHSLRFGTATRACSPPRPSPDRQREETRWPPPERWKGGTGHRNAHRIHRSRRRHRYRVRTCGRLGNREVQASCPVDSAPFWTGLYIQRGVANFGLGRDAESIADLETAVSLDPSSGTPWLILAGTYERLGDAENA